MNRLTRECDVCRREIPLTAVAVEARFLIVVDAPDGRHDEPMLRADVCSPGCSLTAARAVIEKAWAQPERRVA